MAGDDIESCSGYGPIRRSRFDQALEDLEFWVNHHFHFHPPTPPSSPETPTQRLRSRRELRPTRYTRETRLEALILNGVFVLGVFVIDLGAIPCAFLCLAPMFKFFVVLNAFDEHIWCFFELFWTFQIVVLLCFWGIYRDVRRAFVLAVCYSGILVATIVGIGLAFRYWTLLSRFFSWIIDHAVGWMSTS